MDIINLNTSKAILLIFVLFACSICKGQGCYKETRNNAISTFSQKNFKRAKQVFNAAKSCPDKPVKNDLNYWISRCDKAMNPRTQTTEMSFAQKMSQYVSHGEFAEGLMAVVRKKDEDAFTVMSNYDNPWEHIPMIGYINTNADLVIPCKYVNLEYYTPPVGDDSNTSQGYGYNKFYEGVALVVRPEDFMAGYIDKTGKTVVPFKFAGGQQFSEGLAAVVDGEWLSSEDLVDVRRPLKYFIDKQGNRAFPGIYYRTSNFHDGMCAVQTDSLSGWGFINKEGKMVIKCQYSDFVDFKDGMAVVFSKQEMFECALIDKTGSLVENFSFRPEYLTDFKLDKCISYYTYYKNHECCFAALKQYEKRHLDENGIWNPSSNKEAKYSCQLGDIYKEGLGGAVKNNDVAVQYYEKSAKTGHPLSYFKLGYLYAELKEYESSRAYYQKLIDAESKQEKKTYSASALFNVGLQYYNGQGTEKNYRIALDYFQRAKDAGGKSDCDDMIKKCKEKIENL